MNQKNIRVLPRDGEWAVRRDGAERAGSVHATQQAAIQAATATARRTGGEVQIHGRDGKIRERNSYGNDPCPPRG